jgi:EF-P beta-lysylation protein EpmB
MSPKTSSPLPAVRMSPPSSGERDATASDWSRSLARAIRDPDELVRRLRLGDEFLPAARRAAALFPVMVPESYLARMRTGDPNDPLLRQVLPVGDEEAVVPGFARDAVGDGPSRLAPGLLHKYHGRALLIATGACAVHCRYCFRRHYPYGEEPKRLDEWNPALEAVAADDSIDEAILSGGDPLMLTDVRLAQLVGRLATIPHLRRIRIHSRLPIVLPDRVTDSLLAILRGTRLQPIMVVHANHPSEVAADCAAALQKLVQAGVPTLNQSVLLRGINDSLETLEDLLRRLIDLGVIPYYLHQLDRVAGTAHFEVDRGVGLALVAALRTRLPGYAVPQYVEERHGEPSKLPVL